MAEVARKMVEWDGKIPLWGILLMGLSFAGWTVNQLHDLNERMTVRESTSAIYRAKIDGIELNQHKITRLEERFISVTEQLNRIEKKLDQRN